MTERGLKNINVFYSTFTNVFFYIFVTFFLRFLIFPGTFFTSMPQTDRVSAFVVDRVKIFLTSMCAHVGGTRNSGDAGSATLGRGEHDDHRYPLLPHTRVIVQNLVPTLRSNRGRT